MLSKKRPITLITFDVDGTLLQGSVHASTVSVHSIAFNYAVGKVFSPPPAPDDSSGSSSNASLWSDEFTHPLTVIPSERYHGSTDGLIVCNIAKTAFGVEQAEALAKLDLVFEEMFQYVAAREDKEVGASVEALPGVLEKLRQLAHRTGDIKCGLVTGNVEGIARKKMRATGITQTRALAPRAASQKSKVWSGMDTEEDCFLGGFGSDFCSGDTVDQSRMYIDRGEQILICVQRCMDMLQADEHLVRIVHVGDAPADARAAKWCAVHGLERVLGPQWASSINAERIDMKFVGVGTGKFAVEELVEAAGDAIAGKFEVVVLEKGIADPDFISHCDGTASTANGSVSK